MSAKRRTEDDGTVLTIFSKTDTSKEFCLSALHRPVHTVPEEFENGLFPMKTNEMFSVHTAPARRRNFKTQQSPVILELRLKKSRAEN